MSPLVFIGWDPREVQAFEVARASVLAHCPRARVVPLMRSRLEQQGLLRRPTGRLQKGRRLEITASGITRRMVTAAQRGTLWDEISGAPMATEFAISRFAVPMLAHAGIAIFMDCDVLVRADVGELQAIAQARPDVALWCVQHGHLEAEGTKMDGQIQLPYARKNWSSVMVFNCDHPANLAMNVDLLNRVPGRDLHRFCWLNDAQIGRLDGAWNWLVGVQPKPPEPKIAHYTLGGPWLPGWEKRDHDDLWLAAAQDLRPGS